MLRLVRGLAALVSTGLLFGAFAGVAQSPPAGPGASGMPRLDDLREPTSRPDPRRLSGNWLEGYLPRGPLPDSTVLSPPPPAPGSAAEARDLEAAKAALALRGGPRWSQAVTDADVFTPAATSIFSCAAGIAIGPRTTPRLDRLLRRTMADLAGSTSAIKRQYQRQRPFTANGQPVCTPDHEQVLRSDGSYPSGHSAIGYGWGLILAELVPQRAARIVARGRAFGDSRRVCNVHWLSDVEEGRVAAAATVARLHAERAFRADIDAARKELSRTAPPKDCSREEAALAG